MSTASAALAHYRRRAARARLLEREAAALWRQVNTADIAGSWAQLMPRLQIVLTAMQQAEAAESDAYVALAMAEQDNANEPTDRVVPEAFAGVASDGRPLDSLLMQPVVTTKVALAGGKSLSIAMNSGLAALQMIASTQVSDAGRVADQVAMVGHRAEGYVRMVVGATCDQCVVLAGRWYRWNAGFDRHPHCDCIGIPAREDREGDVRTEPMAYFRHLSHEEQDRVFTRAGAQAIRDGADISQVVKARESMYTAGGRRYTREGVSRRAFYGGGYQVSPDGSRIVRPFRYTKGAPAPARLMPESIYKLAAGDQERARQLLRQYGYITQVRTSAVAVERAELVAARAEAAPVARSTKRAGSSPVPPVNPGVRASLLEAKTARQVGNAFEKEFGRITGDSIIAEFEGAVETAQEHAEGLLRAVERFPRARLRGVASGVTSETSFAEASPDGRIFFNPRFTSRQGRAGYFDSLHRCVEDWDKPVFRYSEWRPGSGFHPRNTDTPMAIAIHEFGHILDIATLSHRVRGEVEALLERACAEATSAAVARRSALGLDVEDWRVPASEVIADEIAQYATTNMHELLAEAFADVLTNGAGASKLSRDLVDLLQAEYDRTFD